MPPPPQLSVPVHVPQLSIPPQPSACVPQLAASAAQVVGTHATVPHWLGVPPPPHVSVPVQVPQLSVPPQPLDCVPQVAFSPAHVFAVQPPSTGVPHTPGLPAPPQLSVPVHEPHWMTFPQPSPCGPQLNWRLAHVFATHALASDTPHLFGPAPPHVAGALHVPH